MLLGSTHHMSSMSVEKVGLRDGDLVDLFVAPAVIGVHPLNP